jgi:hypothetical protein
MIKYTVNDILFPVHAVQNLICHEAYIMYFIYILYFPIFSWYIIYMFNIYIYTHVDLAFKLT